VEETSFALKSGWGMLGVIIPFFQYVEETSFALKSGWGMLGVIIRATKGVHFVANS
jgi:hypothetical protein